MTQQISLSDAFYDIGENQFLTHISHIVLLDNKEIGSVLLSIYDWGSAENLHAGRQWLSKDCTYLGRLRRYFFDDDKASAKLPKMIGQGIIGHRKALIFDDIMLNPLEMDKGFESKAIELSIEKYKNNCSFLLFPGWSATACRIGVESYESVYYFQQFGLHEIDDFMMIRYLDESILNNKISSKINT
jgi:hypothetical protein